MKKPTLLRLVALVMWAASASGTHASVYLSGTDGGGISLVADASPQFNSVSKPNPSGIVTTYSDSESTSATGTGAARQSSSIANISYASNASALGFLPSGSTGTFSVSMFDDASISAFVGDYASSNDAFGILFLVDSYYNYSVTQSFDVYSGTGTAHVSLTNSANSTNLFYATSDASHTTQGAAMGVLAPGAYVFDTGIAVSVFGQVGAPLFDFNRLNMTLTLTPMAAPVPEPTIPAQIVAGLCVLCLWLRRATARPFKY